MQREFNSTDCKQQKMTSYNGHRSWNAWNVSLWLGGEEHLYRMCVDVMSKYKRAGLAADFLVRFVLDHETPDGAKYNKLSVKLFLESLEE